jgi:hypothetical protein
MALVFQMMRKLCCIDPITKIFFLLIIQGTGDDRDHIGEERRAWLDP